MNRNRQRGAGKLGTLIWLAILIGVAYCGFKIVPPYIDNYQIEDFMKSEARFANVNRRTPDQLKEVIYKKALEIGIPAKRDDVRVDTVQDGYKISLKYAVVIELPGYTLTLNFNPTADPKSL